MLLAPIHAQGDSLPALFPFTEAHQTGTDTLDLDNALEEAAERFRGLVREPERINHEQTRAMQTVPSQLVCDDVRLATYAAAPFTPIPIAGIPGSVEAPIRIQLLIEAEPAGRTLAERTEEGRFVMRAPVNPTLSLEEIEVEMQFMDALSDCASFAFTIEPLAPAPGLFDTIADDFETKLTTLAAGQDMPSAELAMQPLDTAPLHLRPMIMSARVVYGYDGRPPLQDVMTYTSYNENVTEEEWAVIEAIYAAGAHRGDTGRRTLPEGDAFFRDATGNRRAHPGASLPLLADASSGRYAADVYRSPLKTDGIVTGNCGPDAFYQPTAPQLQDYFERQRTAEANIDVIDNMGNWIENAQVALLAVGAAMGPKGAAGSRAAAVTLTNAMGMHATVISALNEMMHSVYPSELGRLRLEHNGPFAFWEDDETMHVSWEAAEINAYSQSFDFGDVATEVAWAAGGGKAIERFFKTAGAREGWTRSLAEEGTGVTSGTLISDAEANRLQLPACTFGPVDVTREPWTISRPGILGPQVVERLDHQLFNVIREGSGRAHVCVAAELVEAGSSGCLSSIPSYDINVDTKAIDVRITNASGASVRTSIQVEPGALVDLSASVRNANNEQLAWSTDVAAHSVTTDASGHAATVQTSRDEDDFPVTITAESVSITGLRARPDAPRRYDAVVLRAEEEDAFSCLDEFQIAMSELEQCSFVAYVDGTLPGSGRRTPAHPISECVSGTIESWQTNDHGIQHLELRGQFEDGNMQTTLRFEAPGAYTLETTDFGMYGRLMKAIEEPVRSPTGRAAGTRKQSRFSEALELREGVLTVYPLAGLESFYGGRFEVRWEPTGRSARLQGTGYDVEGMLMGGPSCQR